MKGQWDLWDDCSVCLLLLGRTSLGMRGENRAIYRDPLVSGMWFSIVYLVAEWGDVAMTRGEVKAHAAV